LKAIEKKFWKKWFPPQISSKPLSPQETELKKKRERKRKEKENKRKASKVSPNKGEVNILRGERHFNFKIPFQCDPISPPPSYHFENPFQNHWENFLNSSRTIL
jgi:hypothetical protein